VRLFAVAIGLVERYGRPSLKRRLRVGAIGLGVFGGGYLGAVLVGGGLLMATTAAAIGGSQPAGSAFVIGSLGAVLGAVLGAASGGAAAVAALAVVVVTPRAACNGAAAGIGAAIGGGVCTYGLIEAAHLLPDAPISALIGVSLLTAAFDAAVAVTLFRAARDLH
jgi:hypothetical protein